jgi:glycosyltransferase involved in cell wall biosynthesis
MKNSGRVILFLSFGDIPYDQRMQRIWAALNTHGYQIHIIARRKFDFDEKQYPYRITRLKLWFSKGPLSYLEYNVRAFFKILILPVELIYSVDLDTLLAASMSKRVKGGKLIYDAHEYFTETPEVTNRPRTKRIWELIANYTILKADLCITVSKSIADALSDKYKKPFHVVRNVPFLSTMDKSITPERKYILYQGAINEGRGIEELIKAIKGTNHKVVIAGEGDLFSKVKNLINDQQLTDQVTLLGYVSPTDLRKWTSEAWLGVNLLENKGLSYYYSLANKFFDYIMAGKPQITMNFPEYQLINTENEVSVLIDDLSPKTILNAINRLDNTHLYNTIETNCKKAALKYNWENECKILIELIDELSPG